jgi:phospholipase/carboxylesterase
MVPEARGAEARDRLRALGHDVTWRSYPMQHEVCREEIDDVGRWLRERLTPAG